MASLIGACGARVDAERAAPVAAAVSLEVRATAVPPSLPVTHPDQTFVESGQNRDPFRRFALPPPSAARGSRCRLPYREHVRMRDTPIASMALIATVGGVGGPTAMLTDEHGMGQTVHRGDYLGAAEIVSRSDDSPYAVTWRVDRIEHDHLVLVAVNPGAGSTASRVLAMRDG
jgi:Tfp pilus assembly protein PilP